MTRVFDRLMDVMEPDEWYTTMDLTAAVGTDNANVYKTLKKAARDGFIEKGPNRQLPWGMAAIWRLKPPSERSRSRNPLRKPLTPPLLKYRLCNTFIPLTYYINCHDVNGGHPARRTS